MILIYLHKNKLTILFVPSSHNHHHHNHLPKHRGTVIARIVGNNVKIHKGFDSEVRMWVYEEIIQGRKLTEIINKDHENVKYLPDYKIPENVVAKPKLLDTIDNATVLIFVIPHQVIIELFYYFASK